MKNLQKIKSNQQSKYDEIIEYLKQDNGYWLKNDKWDLTEEFFIDKIVDSYRFINFSSINNIFIKNEVKYYFLYSFKNKYLTTKVIVKQARVLKHLSDFLSNNSIKSFLNLDKEKIYTKWKLYLISKDVKYSPTETRYFSFTNVLIDFIKDFYDDREETEKDIWYSKNIKGAKVSASQDRQAKSISFLSISLYYRKTVKNYFKTIITKKAFGTCFTMSNFMNYFFSKFYSNGYTDGFIEDLSRQDIENYLYWVNNDYKNKNATYKSKFISYIRTFLEYIQIAQYDKAPKKEVSFLIFQDDIPKRERIQDEMRKVKFVPEPILKQLDNNIMDLDKPEYIPIYILLRETGWRGTDILNLRYDDCLEQIWNSKEQSYNYYLCGEITKTGIAQLKIPIRDKASLLNTIQRLIKEKDIRDVNGELYHFKLHSLRHTRAKEYIEQDMGISIVQQILGHQSLQMTVHYATVSENVLYEKWKNTEDLELFKVNIETNELIEVDTLTDAGENLVRYEYVKKI